MRSDRNDSPVRAVSVVIEFMTGAMNDWVMFELNKYQLEVQCIRQRDQ